MHAIHTLSAAVLALSSALTVAHAQPGQQPGTSTKAAQSSNAGSAVHTAPSVADKSEGEIRKVDKATRKITIKHGPLKNLDMPAMTMVFLANEPGVLEQVKPGDKVSFVAGKTGSQFTVTQIEVRN